MGEARKRGRKPKNSSPVAANDQKDIAAASTSQHNDTVPESPKHSSTTSSSNPSPPRRGRGRPKKRRRSSEPEPTDPPEVDSRVPSRKRRGGRHHHAADQNGECQINGSNNGFVSHPTSPMEIPASPTWETEVKIVPVMDAVVKVFCVHTEPNFSLPWQRKRQYSSSSSGFIVKGRRVLTNAHSVECHTQVKLKKRGSETKYLATVLAIGTECDIALLTVSDDEFWEGVTPVEFGDLPALQDAVTVVGYPIGGDTISVTSGVVSRMEVLSYVHGSTELLGLQIDAAINSGNSGGPAFNDKGKCVGIAFQSLKHEDAENIGYVIPTPVIMHFLKDYEKNGKYTGFPILGVEWQKMENPDLRLSMGMKPHQKGVRIRRIEPTAAESHALKPSDVILSFDGVKIANDGTVPFRRGERLGFSYLISQKYTGDSAHVEVLRNLEVLEFNIKLATHKKLVPAHINDNPPSYYIVAGFVFTVVSVPYFRSEVSLTLNLSIDLSRSTPIQLYLIKVSKPFFSTGKTMNLVLQSSYWKSFFTERHNPWMNSLLLFHRSLWLTSTLDTRKLSILSPVTNLKCLATMVVNCDDEYLKFDLDYDQVVVLQTKTSKAATMDILATHCIPSAMSDDLKT